MANNTIRIGNVEILSLSDGLLEFDLCNFFPTIPQEQWQPYEAHLTEEDHVGWNLLMQGEKYTPTFPNARYWMSAIDWEACHRPEVRDRFPNAPTCVWPLADLGLVELMHGEHTL